MSLDASRVTLAFFAVGGMRLMKKTIDHNTTQAVIDFILTMQCTGRGFRGGPAVMLPASSSVSDSLSLSPSPSRSSHSLDESHIAQTYSALATLIMLTSPHTVPHDASAVSMFPRTSPLRSILSQPFLQNLPLWLASLQSDSGSFHSSDVSGEEDMRFVYCAAVISWLVQDFSGGVDWGRCVEFIARCQSYEGGFAMFPGGEAHGGTTFCAVAALAIIITWRNTQNESGCVEYMSDYINVARLQEWCIHRQHTLRLDDEDEEEEEDDDETSNKPREPKQPQFSGYSGRTNKPADVCYSHWIGALLLLLSAHATENPASISFPPLPPSSTTVNAYFSLLCQSTRYGGFCKDLHALPDILHSFFGLAGLSEAGYRWLDSTSNATAAGLSHSARSDVDEDEEAALKAARATHAAQVTSERAVESGSDRWCALAEMDILLGFSKKAAGILSINLAQINIQRP